MQMKVSNFFVDFLKRIKQTNKRMNKIFFKKRQISMRFGQKNIRFIFSVIFETKKQTNRIVYENKTIKK